MKSATEMECNELDIKLEVNLENDETLVVVTTYTGQVIAYLYP